MTKTCSSIFFPTGSCTSQNNCSLGSWPLAYDYICIMLQTAGRQATLAQGGFAGFHSPQSCSRLAFWARPEGRQRTQTTEPPITVRPRRNVHLSQMVGERHGEKRQFAYSKLHIGRLQKVCGRASTNPTPLPSPDDGIYF